MRWFKFVILAYIAMVLQTGLFPYLFPDYLRPVALIILANAYLLGRSDEWTILIVWMVGFLGDMTSLSPLGTQALSFGLYGLQISTVRPVLFADSAIAHAVTAAIGVILPYGIYSVLAFITQNGLALPYTVMESLGQALVTGLVAGLLAGIFSPRKRPAMARW